MLTCGEVIIKGTEMLDVQVSKDWEHLHPMGAVPTVFPEGGQQTSTASRASLKVLEKKQEKDIHCRTVRLRR